MQTVAKGQLPQLIWGTERGTLIGAIHRLTAKKIVQTAGKPGVLSDGGGLRLRTFPDGRRCWIYRYSARIKSFGKDFTKSREMGLGSYPDTSLEAAREEAAKRRQQFRSYIDPKNARKREIAERKLAEAKAVTFMAFADEYIESHKTEWSNAKHADQWRNTMKTYAYPTLGSLPVAYVDTNLVLKVLRQKVKGKDEVFWLAKHETASRLRGRIEAILDAAIFQKLHPGPNPAKWKGHLETTLAKGVRKAKAASHAALPYQEIGTFMQTLREQEGIAAKALEVLILTATRTGEIVNANWEEFDLKNALWTIPAARTKTKKEHRVPLNKRAVQILRALSKASETTATVYVFPSSRPKKPLSNMAMLQLLKRMGRGDVTSHGFRSSFRSWMSARTNYPWEVGEAALGHTVGTETERAYQRDDLFEKRRKLMGEWGKYCEIVPTIDGGNVIPLQKQVAL